MAPELLRHLWETHGQQLTSQLRGVAVYEVLRYSGRQVLIEFRRCGIPADPGVIPLVRCPAANTGGLPQHSWLEISVGIAMGAPKVGGCPLRGILAVNRHMTRRVAWELATARVSGVPPVPGPCPCRPCRPCPCRLGLASLVCVRYGKAGRRLLFAGEVADQHDPSLSHDAHDPDRKRLRPCISRQR